MSGAFSCPCDAPPEIPPVNPPGLPAIAYRDATYASLLAALLTPVAGETQLSAWRPGASGDLAVMMAEWFAYLGDILTFYNERIANEDYLRTATQAASVRGLIGVLGYRPQPGIAATATLGALVQASPTAGVPINLPRGLQVHSKPGPGQSPQIFELNQQTTIGAPDAVAATAPLALLSPDAGTLLLAGAVTNIFGGDFLLLRPRGGGVGTLVQVSNVTIAAPPSGPQQTTLSVTFPNGDAPSGPAANFRLDKPTQTASLWSLTTNAISVNAAGNTILQMSGLVRSLKLGDTVLLTGATGSSPLLTTIIGIQDIIWDASGAPPGPTSTALFPHTQLTLNDSLVQLLDVLEPSFTAAAVTFFYNFVQAAGLLDQPVTSWPGAGPLTLVATAGPGAFAASAFPPNGLANVLIADATGAGVTAQATASADRGSITVSDLPVPAPVLQTPLSVMFNLLQVTRGQTVAKESLGSGDPSTPNQAFPLAKSPLTYTRQGGSLVSSLSITVNGQAWTEVPNLFNQPADAPVFITAQDASQNTTVTFGDGVNGARLPAGQGNVVASYRYGSGSAAPPAGTLTVIASPYPGLRALKNPVAAGGGADPDPADQIQTYAPRSVLTFGRAVSVPDYAAIAAAVAAGTRVAAGWAWDAANQRGMVKVYVADDGTILQDVKSALAAQGDPNRPIAVVTATAITVRLGLEILITADAVVATVQAAITTALTDPAAGLFGEQNLGIGQSVFESQIAAACQTVPGYVAIKALFFDRADLGWVGGPVFAPPEGSYFDLEPDAVFVATSVPQNG
jgi:hypothetical protein